MAILPSGFQTLYENASRIFIEEVGKTMTLYYGGLTLDEAPTNVVAPYGLNNYNELGEPVPVDALQGRMSQGGAGFKETPVTESIKVRAYWEKSTNTVRELGLSLQDKVVKINCYLSDVPKLTKCNYAEINSPDNPLISLRITMVRGPVPYGLGQTYSYAISYWKAT